MAHLLSRAGFGGLPAEIEALTAHDWPELVEHMLDTSSAPSPLAGAPDTSSHTYQTWTAMVHFWLERCRTSPAPLAEKMVLFWHGHLCSSLGKDYNHTWLFDQNQLFRTHGLGGFEDLVQQTSVQPAMLSYLDNDRNVKGSPNENFAREVMELFTLGVGNYTEADVVESARAWTGYGINHAGQFQFDPSKHDSGNKTFFGTTQNWNGPATITHILNGPKQHIAARFIASKLWSFLAYPNPEPGVIDGVAGTFTSSGMDIRSLVRAILLHPQFRSDKAKRGLVRSPIEFVVAAMRSSGLSCAETNPQWYLAPMGQHPFYPPNVSGWRQNHYWITPSALWAKSSYVGGIRWELFRREELANSNDRPPAEAVDTALARFGIAVGPSTRNALIGYVENERSHTRWAERAGLLMLPFLTPEFQLA